MTQRTKLWTTFGVIVVVAILAGLVSWPKGPDIQHPRTGELIKELKVHLGLDLQGGSHLVYEADTSNLADTDIDAAVSAARDVIERRVNAFGISEPVVQTNKVGDKYRIIVELPGVQDIDAAVDRIGATPLLEFRQEKKETEEDIQRREEETAAAKISAQDILDRVLAGEDFAVLAKELSDDPVSAEKGGDLDFNRRENWVPEFAEVAFDKTAVGDIYPDIVESSFGFHIIQVTEDRIVTEEGKDIREVRARHILISKPQDNTSPLAIFDYENTGLSGQHLKRADVQFDQTSSDPQVVLTFDSEGTDLFAAITKANIGKQIAIFLDESPISAPVVNQEIIGGQAIISGGFTVDEAKELAQNLNSGALPVPITLIQQQNIGASLGETALQQSFVGGFVGLVLLIIFMIAYYKLPGLLAVMALGIYTLIVLAIFKILAVTLTLAGIAGFILSVGMAVDANVLIFERLREELHVGKSLSQAIEDGFARAWLSIRDSNISSLITCVILAWFGTSLIQGFAITLGIGIIISMISAISITRTFLRLIARVPKLSSWF